MSFFWSYRVKNPAHSVPKFLQKDRYSGSPQSGNSKTVLVQNPDTWESGFQAIFVSKIWMYKIQLLSQTILRFQSISKMLFMFKRSKQVQLTVFGHPVFGKIVPFTLECLITGLVWFSDTYCNIPFRANQVAARQLESRDVIQSKCSSLCKIRNAKQVFYG